MSSGRPILLIAYDFAPEISGVRRIAKLMRWLPEYGWQPTLLTTTPFVATGRDWAPLKAARDAGIEIIRIPSPDPFHRAHRLSGSDAECPATLEDGKGPLDLAPFEATAPVSTSRSGRSPVAVPTEMTSRPKPQRPQWQRWMAGVARQWWFLPDERRGWVAPAADAATAWLQAHPGAPFLTTSYPHSCHLIGLELLKRLALGSHAWVADFRDGWTQNEDFGRAPTPWHAAWHRRLEAEVAKRASLVVSVSAPISEHLRSVGERSKSDVLTIMNGYDEEDAERAAEDARLIRSSPAWPRRPFVAVYTGTFFGTRRAEPLLQGLARLIRTGTAWKARMKLLLFTRLTQEDRDLIQALGLSDVVEERGFLPYRHALAVQAAADALILMIPPGPQSEIMVTQKVFEYLSTGRPIVAAVPPGACRSLLEPVPQVSLADPADPESIAAAIEATTRRSTANSAPPTLSRKVQAGQLAAAMRRLTTRSIQALGE